MEKTWKDLVKGDRIWVNGEKGEIKSVQEKYENGTLVELRITTYIFTNKLLIGRYEGPMIFFLVDSDPRYKTSDPIKVGSGDIISMTEENLEEIAKQFKKEELIEELKMVDKDILSLDKKLKALHEKRETLFKKLSEI